jgi:hypothetical protein
MACGLVQRGEGWPERGAAGVLTGHAEAALTDCTSTETDKTGPDAPVSIMTSLLHRGCCAVKQV